MRNLIYFFYLFLFLNVSCSSTKTTHTAKICDIDLYACLGDTGGKFNRKLLKEGIRNAYIVNGGHYLDPDRDGRINEKILQNFLLKYINPKDSVVIILDWEGEEFKCLYSCAPNSKEFQAAANEFIRGYNIVKKIIPHSLVGYYGFPLRKYWERDEKWRKSNEGLFSLLSKMDVLLPSIYDFYEDTLPFNNNGSEDLKYVKDNTKEAIRVGKVLNKPVIPLIWHRRHESNKKLSRHLIPLDEFYKHVAGIIDTEFEGKKIDGLMWWSAETYFYRINDAEYKKRRISNFEDYQNKIGNDYLLTIKKAMKRNCRN